MTPETMTKLECELTFGKLSWVSRRYIAHYFVTFILQSLNFILGWLFIALWHAEAPMIWFYPLNELELSGYEVNFVLFLFSTHD